MFVNALAVALTTALEALSVLPRAIKRWAKDEKIFRQCNYLLPRQRESEVCLVVVQSEPLFRKEPLLKLAERHVPGNGIVVGSGIEHGCLKDDIFLSGEGCNVSPNACVRL